MYLFMISCYVMMIFNLINLFISVSMGIWNFSFLGSNHAQFSLFAILVFVLTETLVMYFFIATGKSIKLILTEQNTSDAIKLWEEIKYIKKLSRKKSHLQITRRPSTKAWKILENEKIVRNLF